VDVDVDMTHENTNHHTSRSRKHQHKTASRKSHTREWDNRFTVKETKNPQLYNRNHSLLNEKENHRQHSNDNQYQHRYND
jgi:hypothetical protein